MVIFGLRLVDFQVRYLVAVGGIIIGNSMSAATLAGRNFLRASRARKDEIEAWLSLGATPARAHEEIGRESVRESLLPTLDQTKSTGLVTLPGAFVGALFGGASPAVAAQFQLVVLAGIALTMTVTGDRGHPGRRPHAVRREPAGLAPRSPGPCAGFTRAQCWVEPGLARGRPGPCAGSTRALCCSTRHEPRLNPAGGPAQPGARLIPGDPGSTRQETRSARPVLSRSSLIPALLCRGRRR